MASWGSDAANSVSHRQSVRMRMTVSRLSRSLAHARLVQKRAADGPRKFQRLDM
jgi:hypothetical protein